MIEKIKKRIEEVIYGKRLHNLNVNPFYNLDIPSCLRSYFNLVVSEGKARGYIGNFILTAKGYLLRGNDNNLENRTATLDVSNKRNSTGIMGFYSLNCGHFSIPNLSIFYNNKIHTISKNMLGLKLA